eukprot:scaffold552_cov526-Prasinococcus_capsulatus_cf.AAC.25
MHERTQSADEDGFAVAATHHRVEWLGVTEEHPPLTRLRAVAQAPFGSAAPSPGRPRRQFPRATTLAPPRGARLVKFRAPMGGSEHQASTGRRLARDSQTSSPAACAGAQAPRVRRLPLRRTAVGPVLLLGTTSEASLPRGAAEPGPCPTTRSLEGRLRVIVAVKMMIIVWLMMPSNQPRGASDARSRHRRGWPGFSRGSFLLLVARPASAARQAAMYLHAEEQSGLRLRGAMLVRGPASTHATAGHRAGCALNLESW